MDAAVDVFAPVPWFWANCWLWSGSISPEEFERLLGWAPLLLYCVVDGKPPGWCALYEIWGAFLSTDCDRFCVCPYTWMLSPEPLTEPPRF
jgi:hypothetical protein